MDLEILDEGKECLITVLGEEAVALAEFIDKNFVFGYTQSIMVNSDNNYEKKVLCGSDSIFNLQFFKTNIKISL
jgi:hypothetical protein